MTVKARPHPDTTAPTPDPSTWSTEPYATGTTSIRMYATSANDASGVEYYFDETSGNLGGSDSGWQDSRMYEDIGLSPGTSYAYRVRTRDKSSNQNTGSYSTEKTATTDATTPVPEIRVEGSGYEITDGDSSPRTTDGTDFGDVNLDSGSVTRTFTIYNQGTAAWDLTGSPRVSLAGSGDFSVTAQPSSPIAVGDNTSFQVRFEPSSQGLKTATVSIANNDSDENPHDFVIQGAGANGGGLVFVSISEPGFAGQMSKYETTNEQYCQFLNAALASGDITVSGNDAMGASGSNTGTDYVGQLYYDGDGLGYSGNDAVNGGAARINYSEGAFSVDSGFDDHPVTYVSWYGASAFGNYYGYRLPTEEEWQAVADYDGTFVYGCGTSIDSSTANYNSGGSFYADGTTTVGSFGSFGYGLSDMAGNVFEWTSSGDDTSRVGRGGSWLHLEDHCTVSVKNEYSPDSTEPTIGFRVYYVNEAPTIDDGTFDVDEDSANGTVVGQVVASDPEGNITGYALTDGNGSGAFAIDSSGQITVADGSQLDFETQSQYVLTVEVSDAGALTDTAAITVDVNDVNEAPTDIALSANTVPENTDTSSGHVVGTLSSSDPDTSAPFNALSFSIQGGADSARFNVNGTDLVLTDGTLDFENPSDANNDGAYEVSMRVTDGGTPGLTYDETLTVMVADVNEAPTVTLENATTILAEDTDTSTRIKVADIVITDDGLGTSALSLSGADAALFEVVGGNELHLIAGVVLDFETNPTLYVSVEVDDAAVGSTPDDTAALVIDIADESYLPNDWNGDGIISIIGDVPPFVEAVYFGQYPDWPQEKLLAIGDVNGDGILSIIGDVPGFVNRVYFGQVALEQSAFDDLSPDDDTDVLDAESETTDLHITAEGNTNAPTGILPELPGLIPVDTTPEDIAGQIVFLDFDGAQNVVYNGPIIVGPFDVPAFSPEDTALPGQEEAVISDVLNGLEQIFFGTSVVFALEQPEDGVSYSTVYIGGGDWAFAAYSEFYGLAERVDRGNSNRTDQAYVFADKVITGKAAHVIDKVITTIIAHEVGHLLGFVHVQSTE